MTPTEKLLRQYLEEHDRNHAANGGYPLFCNRIGKKLNRAGVAYILNKYLTQARTANDDSLPETISPHCLRHYVERYQMYQVGVDLISIRDLLGHVDISTTDLYARADVEAKRKLLEGVCPDLTPSNELPDWSRDQNLLEYLKNL